ncbi:MAG TPA: Rieske (2Fe-2S) protein [Polyangia bacterium]|jgi:cytochrome b6-f complex iron-sulfur subunit
MDDDRAPEQTGSTSSEQQRQRRERRTFLAILGGVGVAWLGGGAWPVYRYLSPLPQPDPFGKTGRAKVEKLTPADVARPGAGGSGAYAGRGLIVLRAPDGSLRAFDAKCTHAGCNVGFQGDKLFCPCHGGTYDLTGANIAGPPPRPLTRLEVIEEGGVLYVTRKRG